MVMKTMEGGERWKFIPNAVLSVSLQAYIRYEITVRKSIKYEGWNCTRLVTKLSRNQAILSRGGV